MATIPRTIVQVRLTPEDWARVRDAAKRERRTVSDWLRALMLDELGALDRKPSMTGERERKRSRGK